MIKVFYTIASDVSDTAAAIASLPDWRKKLLDKISDPQQRLLSLGAGLLFTHALAELGIDAKAESIILGEHGKPLLRDRPELHFSLSHSGHMIICALADAPVGCDVQSTARASVRIASRFFTPREQQLVSESDDPSDTFVGLWVKKESYVKMTGQGISACPLSSFDVTDSQGLGVTFCHRSWEGYHAATCCRLAETAQWLRHSLK